MPRNYLIGIGGTGARVCEAALHCCAAGFGPAELTVFLIDPDEGNGNLSRTKTLVTRYQRARGALGDRSSDDVRLFGTPVATPDPFVWGIFPDQNQTLGAYVNYANVRRSNPELAQLMEVLFSERELTTPLNEGFRGHPSIGAVVMANAPDDVDPWRTFWSDVDTAQHEHDVRVFLVGSIFGGTGAAGVPTFGAPQMLKWRERAALAEGGGQRRSKVFLGTALVLPYFAIDLSNAPPADEAGAMFVTPADFPIATKAALQYYDERDQAGKLAFDQVYLVGDTAPQPVGPFSPGNRAQENRPHYVELTTALAAFDFFRQDPTAEAVRNGPRFFAASREATAVDWRALPVTRHAADSERLQTEFRRRLAAMTVFAYAFDTVGRRTLAQPHADIRDAWYRSHFDFKVRRPEDAALDPRRAQQALDTIADYGRDFLRWIAALDDEDGRVRLVDRTRLFAAPAGDAPPALLDPVQHAAAVGALLRGEGGRQLQFADFLNRLNAVRLDRRDMPAASRYVNLFYEAALRFVADNWRLTPAAA